MRHRQTLDEEILRLWYGLGRLYSGAAGERRRGSRLGFTATLVSGAMVLLSVPLLGTDWAGPFAAVIPVAVGVVAGGGMFAHGRLRLWRRASALGQALAERGLDASRPTRDGLGAYYDPQLILLRSEYEHLRTSGFWKTARLFEESFGFAPEDDFETGPLNIAPDTEGMRALRERWEKRISMRRARGIQPPRLGLREDLVYRIFPREMTVPVELATRKAYLEVSRGILIGRYGSDPLARTDSMPEALRRRTERDLGEYEAITRPFRRSP